MKLDYRELCVAAGLISEEDDFLPDADDLFGVLERLGMFRLCWTLPPITNGMEPGEGGLYEVEASFPTDEPGSMHPGWRMSYGTGQTRELALVRLYVDRQRNG